VLLLDEPTTFLDVSHQLEVLAMVERLHRESGVTVVMVLHELSMAARYADSLIAMKGGRIVAEGSPESVITEEVLGEVFGIEAEILHDRLRRRPVVVPTAVHREQAVEGER
jgi:iron complex transport system ATP-binding protein